MVISCEQCPLPASMIVTTGSPTIDSPNTTTTAAFCPIHSVDWLVDCLEELSKIKACKDPNHDHAPDGACIGPVG